MKAIKYGLYFVYTLSHNGHIFYIGKCKDVVKRYAWHLNKKGNSLMVAHIQSILNSGEYPLLSIITYKPNLEAVSIEETLIKCLSIGGQNIFNKQHFLFSKNIQQQASRRDIYKRVKAEQEKFHTIVSNFGSYYSPTIRKVV